MHIPVLTFESKLINVYILLFKSAYAYVCMKMHVADLRTVELQNIHTRSKFLVLGVSNAVIETFST